MAKLRMGHASTHGARKPSGPKDISSSYTKILGETNFHAREIPRSGSKAKNGEKEEEEERLNDGDNNGQATHGACKHAWRMQVAWVNEMHILNLTPLNCKLICHCWLV